MVDRQPERGEILAAIDRILMYTEEGQEEFFAQPLIQEGVCKNLAIVRKGCANLEPSLIRQFKLLSLDSPLSGWCDSSEEYFGLGRDLIWELLEEELVHLRTAVQERVQAN
jgi:uncharacterized protein with HEPN domain